MARRRKRRHKIKFGNRKHSVRGIISIVMATISLILFCILVVVSYKMRGNGGVYLGTIGMTSFIINIVGVIVGIKSFQEGDRNYLFSKIGLCVNSIMVLGWLAIYVLGM